MSRTLVAFVAFIALAVGALVFAVARVASAYDWVAHTSDVRVAIGSARSATAMIERDRDACGRVGARIDDVTRLTADNPAQQRRTTAMRGLRTNACDGDLSAKRELATQLDAADATEIELLYQRRARLQSTATWALVLFVLNLSAALFVGIAAARERAKSQRAIVESEERFRHLAESATDLIRIHAPNGKFLYVTPSCERLLGFTPAEILAMPPVDGLVHPDDREAIRAWVAKLEDAAVAPPPITHRLQRKSGDHRWFETRSSRVYEEGKLARFYTTSRDIHDRVEAERRLEEIAVTDELTGLHNRRGFMLLAGHEHRLALRQGRGLVLVFVDLDGLKAINDGLGHEEGDAAIRAFAGVMRTAFRASDILARLGGDEFVALAFDVDGDAAKVLESRLEGAIDAFNASGTAKYRLAASIGCVAAKDTSLEELLAEADRTMYERKRAKRASRSA
jgi:diguanylate cyclase (GGDEF)-like protein/PAS domain S-box-containing protein